MNVLAKGGVGKTCLTVAACRDETVRQRFDNVAYASVSQTPNLLDIIAKLYAQLSRKGMSETEAGSVKLGNLALQSCSKERNVLVVLDDVWEIEVVNHLDFLDENSDSRLLISTVPSFASQCLSPVFFLAAY
jgi:hypothetical protein